MKQLQSVLLLSQPSLTPLICLHPRWQLSSDASLQALIWLCFTGNIYLMCCDCAEQSHGLSLSCWPPRVIHIIKWCVCISLVVKPFKQWSINEVQTTSVEADTAVTEASFTEAKIFNIRRRCVFLSTGSVVFFSFFSASNSDQMAQPWTFLCILC